MASENDEIERDFAKQDKEWTGPRFFQTGIITLILAVGLIVYAATRTGCSVAIVP